MIRNDDRYKALKLESQGQSKVAAVVDYLRASKLNELCYAFKVRTKSEERLLEKKNRKQKDKPTYELFNITDVVGLRLVALFRGDMIEILEGCLNAIGHSNGVSPNPFVKGMPEEVIYYKGNSAFDDLASSVKGLIDELCGDGCNFHEEASREGYSSIHLVARLTGSELEKDFGRQYQLPIEIQIRTVFEDAWGEIDHKYGYILRTGKHTGKSISNPEGIKSHLRVLKRFADGCSAYSEAIRIDAERPTMSLQATTKVISVEMDDELIERFKTLGVADELIHAYVECRKIKERILSATGEVVGDDLNMAAQAAEAFRQLADKIENERFNPVLDKGLDLLYYYSRMNEAFCLIAPGTTSGAESALQVYRSIEGEYTGFPLLRMRLGQAYGKVGHFDKALKCLRETGVLLNNLQTEKVSNLDVEWSDEVPRSDYEHMMKVQPKLTGYYIWNLIEALQPSDHKEKAVLYLDAYRETLVGLKHASGVRQTEMSYRNNLLYYALGFRVNAEKIEDAPKWDCLTVDDSINEHLAFFDGMESDGFVELTDKALDTLMTAYAVCQKTESARNCAEILKRRVLSSERPEVLSDPALSLRFLRKSEAILTDSHAGLLEL